MSNLFKPSSQASIVVHLNFLRDPETRQPGQELARLPFVVTVTEGEVAAALPALHSAVAVVLDRSGSMSADGKLPAAQSAGLHAIDLTGDNSELILFAFNSQTTRLGSTKGGWLRDTSLKAALRAIQPENGTAIGAALSAAFSELRTREGVRRLTLLSDGQTQDEALCYQMAQAFAQEHIPIDFLATDDVNIALAQHLTDTTGGRLEYLARLTPPELTRFFGQQMQAAQNVIVQNVRVRVRLHSGACLTMAAACYPDIIPAAAGTNVEASLGDLTRADKLQFYGEVTLPVPAQDARVPAGEIVITYDLPQTHRLNEQVTLPLIVTFVAGAQATPDAQTLACMQQVKAKMEMDQAATTSDPAQALVLLQSAERRTRLAGDTRKTQVITGLIDDVRRTNVVSDSARKTAITTGRCTKIVP